jgi:nucleotide-binding universal stress UspA family protein
MRGWGNVKRKNIMSDFKKILVALGFSEYDQGIFSYAAKLASGLDAELVVGSIINQRDVDAVGTISSMGYEVNGDHYVASIREERESQLKQIVKKSSFPVGKIKVIIRVGNPVEELLKITVEENVDMAVMGIKGRTDLEYIFAGSVAEKIFERSPVPIVSYRDEKNAAQLRKRIKVT